MEVILTNKSISLNQVKTNHSTVINELNDDAAAIIYHDEISAYLVSKKRFQELCDAEKRCELEDQLNNKKGE